MEIGKTGPLRIIEPIQEPIPLREKPSEAPERPSKPIREPEKVPA